MQRVNITVTIGILQLIGITKAYSIHRMLFYCHHSTMNYHIKFKRNIFRKISDTHFLRRIASHNECKQSEPVGITTEN